MLSGCHAIEPGPLVWRSEHVWHSVDLGSSPGGVTTLSLRYTISLGLTVLCEDTISLGLTPGTALCEDAY